VQPPLFAALLFAETSGVAKKSINVKTAGDRASTGAAGRLVTVVPCGVAVNIRQSCGTKRWGISQAMWYLNVAYDGLVTLRRASGAFPRVISEEACRIWRALSALCPEQPHLHVATRYVKAAPAGGMRQPAGATLLKSRGVNGTGCSAASAVSAGQHAVRMATSASCVFALPLRRLQWTTNTFHFSVLCNVAATRERCLGSFSGAYLIAPVACMRRIAWHRRRAYRCRGLQRTVSAAASSRCCVSAHHAVLLLCSPKYICFIRAAAAAAVSGGGDVFVRPYSSAFAASLRTIYLWCTWHGVT